MEHLLTDEMIAFVSEQEMNAASIALAAKVTGHIRRCPECLQTVRSLQMVYDAFRRAKRDDSFHEYLVQKLALADETAQDPGTKQVKNDFDGYR